MLVIILIYINILYIYYMVCAVHGVVKSWTQLGNWTTTIMVLFSLLGLLKSLTGELLLMEPDLTETLLAPTIHLSRLQSGPGAEVGERLPLVGFYSAKMQCFSPPTKGKRPVLGRAWELVGIRQHWHYTQSSRLSRDENVRNFKSDTK